MNRDDEYRALLADLNDTPPGLEHTIDRARKKVKQINRIKRFIFIPVSSAAVFFITFVVMVNVSVSFAMACGRIPLIRELAAAVAFSPSLSAAVENEYVQPIELEQTIKDIKMRVEYVIVDQKQLNIFYSLQSEKYFHMDMSPAIRNVDGSPLEGYGIHSGQVDRENGKLRLITVDFIANDVPDSLVLTARIHDNGSFETSVAVVPVPPADVKDSKASILEEETFQEPEAIAVFDFILAFDPHFTSKSERIILNQSFVIDGQRLTLQTVEIFPTHVRINLSDDEENSAWLQSLGFYLENEKGERFDTISNGISATGSEDSPFMPSHRLESAFFSKSHSLTLHVTDVIWLDKAMERVKVDLANVTAEALPEGVALEKAIRTGNGWWLTFAALEWEENHSYQLFGSDYYDESGNDYRYNSWTSGMTGYYDENIGEYVETPGVFRVEIPLNGYPYDTVYLSPSYTRRVDLESEIVLKVK